MFKVLIHAFYLKNALLIFRFMLIIFLSVNNVFYSENVAFIFKSCAIYIYLPFFILFFIFLSVTAIL